MAIAPYLALLTSQYATKPNLTAWLSALLQPLDDTGTAGSDMVLAFEVSQAVGAQLDHLGQIIGVSRTVNFQPSNGVSPVLDDATYRLVLQARILANQWDGTTPGLYGIWTTVFPGIPLQITDNQNMTASAQVTGLSSSIQQDLISHGYIIPKAAAVAVTYTFASALTTAITFPLAFPVVLANGIVAASTVTAVPTVT